MAAQLKTICAAILDLARHPWVAALHFNLHSAFRNCELLQTAGERREAVDVIRLGRMNVDRYWSTGRDRRSNTDSSRPVA